MERFISRITAALATAAELPADEIRLEQPRSAEHGDFAFPCFPLAKALACS